MKLFVFKECITYSLIVKAQHYSLCVPNVTDSWANTRASPNHIIEYLRADEISEMRAARDTFRSYATCRTGVPSRKPINKSKERVRHSQPGVLSLSSPPSVSLYISRIPIVSLVSSFGRSKQRLAQICKSEFLDVAMFIIITRNLIISFLRRETPQVLNVYINRMKCVSVCVWLLPSCFISWATPLHLNALKIKRGKVLFWHDSWMGWCEARGVRLNNIHFTFEL